MRVKIVQVGKGNHGDNILYYFTPEEIKIKKESGSTSAAERPAFRGEVSPLSIDRIAQKQGEIKGFSTPYRDAYYALMDFDPYGYTRNRPVASGGKYAAALEQARYEELNRKFLDGTISPEEADELWELERIRG